MVIYPAIDLKDGKCVRLLKGDMNSETVYSIDPSQIAERWQEQGATHLHVVDLDGAIKGRPVNLKELEKIRKTTDAFVQFGGGVRTRKIVTLLIDIGIDRIIIGTKAISGEYFLKEILDEFGDKISVSLDAIGDKLAVKGWVEATDESVFDAAKKLETNGVKRFVYTQINRDGTLNGPDIDGLKKLASAVKAPVIASGGIGGIEDIEKIIDIEDIGIDGIIVGKALYENKVNLVDAIALARDKGQDARG